MLITTARGWLSAFPWVFLLSLAHRALPSTRFATLRGDYGGCNAKEYSEHQQP